FSCTVALQLRPSTTRAQHAKPTPSSSRNRPDQAQPTESGRKLRHNHSSPAQGRSVNSRMKPSSNGNRYTSIVPRLSTRAARLVPNALTNQYSSQAAQIRETTAPKGK